MFYRTILSSESREDFLDGLCCCMTGICVIPATLLVMALQLALSAATVAFNGFLCLITGHAILRHADFAVYGVLSLQSSMQVGAAGGAIMFPALAVSQAVLEYCLGVSDAGMVEGHVLVRSVARNMLNLCMSTAIGAAAGGVGSTVLLSHGVSVLGPVDAARAGAVGGAVLGPSILVGGLILGLILSVLCDPGSLDEAEGV